MSKYIPKSDSDFAGVALTAANKWANSPISLLWIDSATFATLVNDFKAQLDNRQKQGGKRPAVTAQLNELDKEINANLSYVKGYISEKFGKKNAESYYPQFGIERMGKVFRISNDRDKRNQSLKMMVDALDTHSMTTQQYGHAYWSDVLSKYDNLKTLAVSTDSSVSGAVKDKNTSRSQIEKALTSLIYVIQANYPDTYESELREWGFQREKY